MKEYHLPFREHLSELRTRLTWSAGILLACTIFSFIFHEEILTLLMEPAGGFSGIPNKDPIYTNLTEYLGTAMKVSLLGGVILSSPFLLLQIAMFVSPGLNQSEKRYLYSLIPVSLIAFAIGAAFGYQILLPPAIKFLLTFGNEVATPYIRIGNYTNLVLTLLFWMGIVFEIPVVLFFLSKIGVVTPEFLARQRRYAIVIAFILGALITPTFDPINQTLVALPIIALYEISIWLAKLGGKNRDKNPREANIGTKI